MKYDFSPILFGKTVGFAADPQRRPKIRNAAFTWARLRGIKIATASDAVSIRIMPATKKPPLIPLTWHKPEGIFKR